MNFKLIFGLLSLHIISVCLAKQTNFGDDILYDYVDPESLGNVEEEDALKSDGEKPVFRQKSQKITVKEGENVTMDCTVKKATGHMLIFQRMEQLVFVGNMKVVKESKIENKDDIFILPDAQRSETGIYECVYQSKPNVKIAYEVDVQFAPVVFTKTPKIQKVEKGASVSVKCQAKGNPTPEIMWSKANGRLPSGKETEKGVSLTLEDVDRHVEGTYVCTAQNGVGEPASTALKVMVEYAPEIITEKAIVRTGEGDIVELVCIVHSRPAASVTWTRNGEELESSPDFKEEAGGHKHSITISEITEEKFGAYQCTAENLMGVTSDEINLTDEPKQPHFTSPEISAMETMYTLAWETESFYPITEYTVKYRLSKANESTDMPGEWHEEIASVSEDSQEKSGVVHRMKHQLKNLKPATDYEAVVTVKNKLKLGEEGSFSFSTRKAAITPPPPPPFILGEEKVQYSIDEEMVSPHTVGGSYLNQVSVAVLSASLIIALIS